MKQEFWDWEKPVLQWASELLMDGFAGGEADFSDTLFVVPTAEAGRRLKEALARAAASAGGGAVVPHVWAPEQLLMTSEDRERAASRLKSLLAWAVVLERLREGECETLFGSDEGGHSWQWCLSTAELMVDLSSTLGAGGWTFQSVADSEHAAVDAARWRDLALLERRYFQLLEEQGRDDVQRLKAARAEQPVLPEGVLRVWVLAAPDLPPLAVRWLESVSKQVEVRIHVLAPGKLREAFDSAGRPVSAFWSVASALGAATREEDIVVSMNSAGQAAAVVTAVGELAGRARTAVGVCDAEVSNAVLERMSGEGVRVFEPGGLPPVRAGLWHVMQCFQHVLEREPWTAFATLLRVHEVRAALCNGQPDPKLLEVADDFAAGHLPLTMTHARSLLTADDLMLAGPLEALTGWREDAQNKVAAALVRDLLMWLYGRREFVTTSPTDRLHLDLAEECIRAAEEVDAELEAMDLALPIEERLALVLKQAERVTLSEPRGAVDLVLQGWLELLWEASPGLVVAGVNEENVPGILISHPFLPDGLREKLGLACQSSRYARDAYLCHAISAQRVPGNVRWICGQWSDRGDALKPSRLLLRCEDKALPARVRMLFPKDDAKKTVIEPPRSLAWKLKPEQREPKALTHISHSRLSTYLRCPFDYYLNYDLKWGEAVDPDKQEMDAMEFGKLLHHALERFAQHPALKVSENATEIADFLEAEVEHRAKELWGSPLPMLVRLQVEGARQRLRAVADSEVAARQDGWQIMHAEFEIESEEHPVLIGGARLRGSIDRIERRERGGINELRVLDFKTGDSARSPKESHVSKVSARKQQDETSEWKRVLDRDAKTVHQWSSLQLPLYAAALHARGLGVPAVGYFCLPKAVQHTGVLMWEEFDQWWMERALEIAEAAVTRINAQVFWPPEDEERSDDAAFLGDVLGTVAWPADS